MKEVISTDYDFCLLLLYIYMTFTITIADFLVNKRTFWLRVCRNYKTLQTKEVKYTCAIQLLQLEKTNNPYHPYTAWIQAVDECPYRAWMDDEFMNLNVLFFVLMLIFDLYV